ncbi:NADPH--cytochrome P450 reductase [Dirofilaria immitis]
MATTLKIESSQFVVDDFNMWSLELWKNLDEILLNQFGLFDLIIGKLLQKIFILVQFSGSVNFRVNMHINCRQP